MRTLTVLVGLGTLLLIGCKIQAGEKTMEEKKSLAVEPNVPKKMTLARAKQLLALQRDLGNLNKRAESPWVQTNRQRWRCGSLI